jgi:D-alanyl-D-alanine carboxypeptidase/D-alanyl-D-alanine-endopeptidase (penicillin-binding protein 4)
MIGNLDLIMIKLSLLTLVFNFGNFHPITPLSVVRWDEAAIFNLPTQPDPKVQTIVDNYLQDLGSQSLPRKKQGIWIQSDWAIFGDNQGKIPVSAASITKIATTLASVHTWDLEHQFLTKIYTSGKLINGVLDGDLIIEGDGDPLFVWEEAIALGNKLNELGIKEVKGNLIIVGDFTVNFAEDSLVSAQLFKQALNSTQWSNIIEEQYQNIVPLPPRPVLDIQGNITLKNSLPPHIKLLITHQSLTLEEILKLMNIYSNNKIAEKLALKIGGGQKVSEIASKLAQVPREEIQLINGSGLGVDNRISPRAACRMLIALGQLLEEKKMNLGDLFPVSEIDQKGTIEDRNIPLGVAVKTGTLATVSALAGVFYTKERQEVWFAIINHGSDIEFLRSQQDILLQNLAKHWSLTSLTPKNSQGSYFGDPSRNL